MKSQVILTGMRTLRRWAMLHDPYTRIVELLPAPAGWVPGPPPVAGVVDNAALNRRAARETLHHGSQVAKLPQLPSARCAACGAEAVKHCAACSGPSYCSTECQRRHWKEHRAACKAAVAHNTPGNEQP